ncbi:MAG TPA: hypothetical protein DEP99_05335 [Nitrospiraceae bacterium]|nr:hypothetical protein [Nitrospiraceae bacterium]
MINLNELRSTFNILRKKFPDYEERPQQFEMAEAVFACLKDKKRLLIEGGTGVGKSFAYLIPTILSGEKTVVSTATIALQDQLVNKDLIFLQKSLPQEFSFAILKGKNNYLCLKREREFQPEIGGSYKKFFEWVNNTERGDKEELPFVPEFWSNVCGDSDDCGGKECPFYKECFYYKHYKVLYKNDIIVVNHHLLVYDLVSDLSLLPFHKQLIIDEAHRIEDVISSVLGNIFSYPRLLWLLYRLRKLKISVDHLFEPVNSFFKRKDIVLQGTSPIPELLTEELKNLRGQLSLQKVIQRLKTYLDSTTDGNLKDKMETTIKYINSLDEVINDFISKDDTERVYYLTENRGYIELRSSLIECRLPFSSLIEGYESVIMTSATLTAGGDFTFLKDRLGLVDFREKVIGSPFDYKKQALLYIERSLPSPREDNDGFHAEGVEIIKRLINTSRGRALVLFTSYSHLNYVTERLRIEYPFKRQGELPPARLIEWFKKTPNSVLLATTTFWQGIDIKGEDLSLVIISKIPFGSPGDPVYDERCRRLGGRWFHALALPSAILLLKQGFGRLIRGVDDYGVVAILDTRIIMNSYGKVIVSSLPEMDIVHSIEDVKRFFDSIPVCSHNTPLPLPRGDEGEGVFSDKKIFRVVTLGNLNDPSVISELINFANSENGNERRLAASALGKLARFKPEIYKAVDTLEDLLNDEKPQVRHYAMKALGKIGKVKHERLKAVIDNPYEKEYNVLLAKRLMNKIH